MRLSNAIRWPGIPILMSKRYLGIGAVLGASLMWAIEPVLAKLSYHTTDFLQTFLTRILFALITITIYLTSKRKGIKILRSDLPRLLYLSLIATLLPISATSMP